MGICCAKPAPKLSLVADPYHPSLAVAEPSSPQPNTSEKKKKKMKKAKASEKVNGKEAAVSPVPTGNGEVKTPHASVIAPGDSVVKPDEKPVEKPVQAEWQATKAKPEANPEAEAPKHPDFSGSWVLTSYVGDAEKFMMDINIGWAIRKLAKTLGMGVNKTFSDIAHDQIKNTLTITDKDAQNRVSNIFLEINGTEQENTVYEVGGPIGTQYTSPKWSEDGQTIEAEIRDRKGVVHAKRFLVSPTEMHVKLTTTKGNVFEQIFTKQ